MNPKTIQVQREFGGGQISVDAKRRDDTEIMKTGAREMLNWRHKSAGVNVQRPGRTAVFKPAGPRTDYVRMAPGKEYFISFSANTVTITDLLGAPIWTDTNVAYLWTNATVQKISWCQASYQIFICYPGMRPRVIAWDRSLFTWTISAFTIRTISQTLRGPFYRFSAPGATMTYSGKSGSITLTSSVPFFKASMVGSKMSIIGQQVTITGVTDSTHATATVSYRLPDWITIWVASTAPFIPGQIVSTLTSSFKFEVGITGYDTVSGKYYVSGCLTTNLAISGLTGGFVAPYNTDKLISPIGSSGMTAAITASTTPQPTVQWLEEFMSDIQGWPQACAFDAGRLIFFDFPQMPEAILWSSLYGTDMFWVDATAAGLDATAGADAASAILELISPSGRSRPRVRHVVGWADEFVFTDRGVYYIPISEQNPLKPGSVSFREITRDACSDLRPVSTTDALIYINAGLNRASMVTRTGGYSTPYAADDASGLHADLFKSPVGLSVATGDGPHPERYVYVVNTDGSVVVGNFTKTQGKVVSGWSPWVSTYPVVWATVSSSVVYYSTDYGSGGVIIEREDDAAYVDGAVAVNAVPTSLQVVGKGPIWWAAGANITLMDGFLDMGERAVDALGNIIPSQGEDLSSATLTAGIAYPPSTIEPFVPNVGSGENHSQRFKRRRISGVSVTATGRTGLTVHQRTFSPYRFGDDQSVAPPEREATYVVRPLIRAFDPRVKIIKDRPGPCTIHEISLEVSV